MPRSSELTRAFVHFLGPVAGAIKGELSKQETARALVKALVVGVATRASLAATIQQPDVLADVVVPLAAAGFTGALDALSRLEQGNPKSTSTLVRTDEVPSTPIPHPPDDPRNPASS